MRGPETLADVGDALYGPSWQTPLSEALGVSDRTVRRWVSGEFDVPAGVWADIAKICDKRSRALTSWADRLSS